MAPCVGTETNRKPVLHDQVFRGGVQMDKLLFVKESFQLVTPPQTIVVFIFLSVYRLNKEYIHNNSALNAKNAFPHASSLHAKLV